MVNYAGLCSTSSDMKAIAATSITPFIFNFVPLLWPNPSPIILVLGVTVTVGEAENSTEHKRYNKVIRDEFSFCLK